MYTTTRDTGGQFSVVKKNLFGTQLGVLECSAHRCIFFRQFVLFSTLDERFEGSPCQAALTSYKDTGYKHRYLPDVNFNNMDPAAKNPFSATNSCFFLATA